MQPQSFVNHLPGHLQTAFLSPFSKLHAMPHIAFMMPVCTERTPCPLVCLNHGMSKLKTTDLPNTLKHCSFRRQMIVMCVSISRENPACTHPSDSAGRRAAASQLRRQRPKLSAGPPSVGGMAAGRSAHCGLASQLHRCTLSPPGTASGQHAAAWRKAAGKPLHTVA